MGAILEEPMTIVYPSSDGKPMAETEIHILAIVELLHSLKAFFRDRPDVFVIADMLWYWKEGRTKTTAPDLMVVPGVGNDHRRRSFFTWRENGAVPAVVFEIASQGSWRKDLTSKRRMYERRGVKEYFIFDPENLYLPEGPLLGFRLDGIRYRTLLPADGTLRSDLGFDLRPEGEILRLIDRSTGIPIPTPAETMERAYQAEEQARVAEESVRREAGQSAQLRAEIERLKAMLAKSGSQNGNGP